MGKSSGFRGFDEYARERGEERQREREAEAERSLLIFPVVGVAHMCDLLEKGHQSTWLGLEWLVLGSCASEPQGIGSELLTTHSTDGLGFRD